MKVLLKTIPLSNLDTFSETNPTCQNIKQLFTLPIPKSGTSSYDVLKSNLNKVLDISDKIMKQFQLKLSVKSDEQI